MATKQKKIDSKSVSTQKTTSHKRTDISHEEIERQAYMLWLERGGNSMDNWLDAERKFH